jgi:hypothetical protein
MGMNDGKASANAVDTLAMRKRHTQATNRCIVSQKLARRAACMNNRSDCYCLAIIFTSPKLTSIQIPAPVHTRPQLTSYQSAPALHLHP